MGNNNNPSKAPESSTPQAVRHTPGPWRVVHEWYQQGWTEGHEVGAGSGGKDLIARTYRGWGTEMQEANARLIAAAPDMLEALKEAKLQIEYLHSKFQDTGSGNAVLAKIDAALNKAEGREL